MLILERARRALDVVSAIRGLAIRDHEPMEGPLRLGVIPTIGPYLIPHVLTAIRSGFPKLQLFLREDLTSNLLERLRQGTLDALLLALPVRGEDIQTMGLFREAFVVALPKEHSLVRRKHLGEGTLTHDMMLSASGAGKGLRRTHRRPRKLERGRAAAITVRRATWQELFAAAVCGDAVHSSQTLATLALHPLDSIAIKDSPGAVAAARAADIPVVVT